MHRELLKYYTTAPWALSFAKLDFNKHSLISIINYIPNNTHIFNEDWL